MKGEIVRRYILIVFIVSFVSFGHFKPLYSQESQEGSSASEEVSNQPSVDSSDEKFFQDKIITLKNVQSKNKYLETNVKYDQSSKPKGDVFQLNSDFKQKMMHIIFGLDKKTTTDSYNERGYRFTSK